MGEGSWLFCLPTEQRGNLGVPVGFCVGQRRAAPAVGRPGDGTHRQQVADHLELAFGGGQVQRGAPVVVSSVRLDPGGDERADLVEVALAGCPGERYHGLGLGLVLLPPRVALGCPSPPGDKGVEEVDVVLGDQLAAELDATDGVPVLV